MISPCRGNILHKWGSSKMPWSPTAHANRTGLYQLRLCNLNTTAIKSIQTPAEPDSFQPWPKLLQQLRKPTLRLPWCEISFGFWDTQEVPLLSKRAGREDAREEHSPKWGRRWEEQPDWHTSLAQCMHLFSYMQSLQGDVGCSSCLCSAESPEPSHVPQTAEKRSGVLEMWQGMLETCLTTSTSSFLSAAQMAEKQIFFTDITKIFQL